MSPREAELTRELQQALQANAALQRENQLLREKSEPMKPSPSLFGTALMLLRTARWTRGMFTAILTMLLCSGCTGPTARKLSVSHSPLARAASVHDGKVVLREGIESYSHQRDVIGQQNMHESGFLMMFNPMASFAFTTEIKGGHNLNEVLGGYITEVLTNAGYTVQVQKNPRKALSRKHIGTPILEFDIDYFKYSYGSSRGEPDSMGILLRLTLLDPGSTNTLWRQEYRVSKSKAKSGGEPFIREAVDELLNRVAADVSSEDFYNSITSVSTPVKAMRL
ncbi:MAG TPA: hypothetical protein VN673_07455 [Clostridia bacterium]|nr:hypothetical protein [Clostridia bacterium]